MFRWGGVVATGLAIASVAAVSGVPAQAAKPSFRGDGIVRLADGPWVGQGVPPAGGAFETEHELEVLGAGTYSFRFRIVNTGKLRSDFDIAASRWSTPPATCDYKVVRRGKNITKKITESSYVEKALKAGDKTTYKVTISAAASDDQCGLEFKSYPVGHFDRRDSVIITVANTA